MAEDEMVGWHHRLNGHEFEQTPGDGGGQGSLAYCSPWGHKELDMTQRLSNNNWQLKGWTSKFSLYVGSLLQESQGKAKKTTEFPAP